MMKTKSILLLLVGVSLFACTSKPKTHTFNINVDLANTEGKTAYLLKDGLTLDSAELVNWKATFATPVCNNNEMYSLMLKGWRRPFYFFTDNTDVTLEGDAQNPNAIIVKGSESQDRLNAFTEGFMALDEKMETIGDQLEEAKKAGDQQLVEQLQLQYDDAQEIEKMYCFDYVWEHPTDPVAHYVLYRYKWALVPVSCAQ